MPKRQNVFSKRKCDKPGDRRKARLVRIPIFNDCNVRERFSWGWKDASYTPVASSSLLGWKGLRVFRFQDLPSGEIYRDPSPLHIIILTNQPPEKLYQRFEGLSLDKPPIPGSISMVPTDSFAEWTWEGTKDSLHVFMERARRTKHDFTSRCRALVPACTSLLIAR